LPAEDACYDAALCSFGLLHLADPVAAIAEMHRVLRPEGRVALSHWCGPDLSPFFRIVFGSLAAHADMTVVPAAPPPFALSTRETLQEALVGAGSRMSRFARRRWSSRRQRARSRSISAISRSEAR
jgi:SAM-dependent methyltransferase